jgi:hypothetical protein
MLNELARQIIIVNWGGGGGGNEKNFLKKLNFGT